MPVPVIVDIYGRVSTQEQAQEGYSIHEQEARLIAFASAHGWIINSVYMDGGYSGASLARPGIQSVIQDCQKHNINKVVVYKLDRLSRSQKDTIHLIEDIFIANDVDFISMTESLDTSSPLGMAMIGIISVFAQLERSQISERMMLGRDARVKTGKYHGNGNNVVGFEYKNGILSLNEYDSMMIRNIFQLYASGMSCSAIARKVTQLNWRGHEWLPNKIRRLLTQPLYVGRQRWKHQEYIVDNCPPVIDEDLWFRVQDKLSQTQKPQRPQKHVSLLGGMLWCGRCGARYAVMKSRNEYRCYCYSRIHRNHGYKAPDCDNIGYLADKLDEIVISQIRLLQLDSPLSETPPDTREIEALQSRIAEITASESRIIELYSIGALDAAAIKSKAESLQKERESLQNQLDSLQAPPSSKLKPEEYKKAVSTFNDLVDTVDKMDLYDIIRILINSITLDGDNIRIEWNF